MKIINSEPHLNLINNGFVYLCPADDGTYWIRSVAGKWAQIEFVPMKFADLEADFDAFMSKNQPVSLTEIKADNTDQIVIEPTKITTASLNQNPNPITSVDPTGLVDTTATSTPLSS